MLSAHPEAMPEADVSADRIDATVTNSFALPDITHKNLISHNAPAFQNQAEKIEKWLRQYGFAYNPFQFTNSEKDSNLTKHFVEDPDFEKTLGLEDRLLFARTGDGKTATRLWVQSYYRDAVRDYNVFVFSYLVPHEIAIKPPTDIVGHIEPMLTAAVRHAFVLLALRGIDLPALRDGQTAQFLAGQFAAYFDEYYGLLNSWRDDLDQAVLDYSLHQVMRNLAPVYDDLEALEIKGNINLPWLKRWLQLLKTPDSAVQHCLPTEPLQRWDDFCKLIQATGLQKILILVDGVDIKPSIVSPEQATGKPDVVARMEAIVRPLLVALEHKTLGPEVAWKLFLPMEIYLLFSTLLSKSKNHAILFWNEDRLRQLLKFRLQAATNNTISTLLQLTDEDVPFDIETFLVVQSLASPRYLLHYINKILALHVDLTQKDGLPGKLSGKLLSQMRYVAHRPT